MYKQDLSLCGTELAHTFIDLPRRALAISPVDQKPTVKEFRMTFVLFKLEDTPSLACDRILGLLQPPLCFEVTVDPTLGSHSQYRSSDYLSVFC